jgi:hypothetical protein
MGAENAALDGTILYGGSDHCSLGRGTAVDRRAQGPGPGRARPCP